LDEDDEGADVDEDVDGLALDVLRLLGESGLCVCAWDDECPPDELDFSFDPAAASRSSSSLPHPGSRTPISQISSALRSEFASPSRR
jgi:hypothetical protein